MFLLNLLHSPIRRSSLEHDPNLFCTCGTYSSIREVDFYCTTKIVMHASIKNIYEASFSSTDAYVYTNV